MYATCLQGFRCLLIAVLLCLYASARVNGQNIRLNNISEQPGLIAEEHYSLNLLQSGHLITCGHYGIAAFDGQTADAIDISAATDETSVNLLYVDGKNRLWFEGWKGLLGYYDTSGVHLIEAADTLSKLGSHAEILVGENDTIYVHIYRPERRVVKVYKDAKGKWSKLAVVQMERNEYILRDYNTPEEVLAKVYIEGIRHDSFVKIDIHQEAQHTQMIFPTNGRVWHRIFMKRGVHHLFFILDEHVFSFRSGKMVMHEKYPKDPFSIYDTHDGSVYVCYVDSTLYRIPANGKVEQQEFLSEGTLIYSFLADSTGMWLNGTTDLYYWNQSEVRVLEGGVHFAEPEVRAACLYKERLYWTDLSGKVYYWNNDRKKAIPIPFRHREDRGSFGELSVFGDALYLLGSSTYGGVYRLDTANGLWVEESVYGGNRMLTYHNTLYTVDWDMGVYPLSKGFGSRKFINARGLLGGIEYHNRLYLRTYDGWFAYNGKAVEKAGRGPFFDAWISHLDTMSNDRLLITSMGAGLCILSDEDTLLFDAENGLSNSYVRHAVEDRHGRVWVASDQGVEVFELMEGQLRLVRRYRQELLKGRVNKVLLADNYAIVVCESGFTYLPLNDIEGVIPEVKLYGFEIAVNDSIYRSSDLFLESGDHAIAISYRRLAFDAASRGNFVYRMSGANEPWITSELPEVYLNNLPPGEYNIEMASLNVNDEPNSAVKIISVTIAAPIYEQTWFLLLCVLLGVTVLLLLVYRLFRRKMQKLKLENTRLTERLQLKNSLVASQLSPHFIFNTINNMEAELLMDNKYEAYNYLQAFAVLVRQVLDHSRKGFITVSEEVKFLREYCQLEARRYGDGAFDYRIRIEEEACLTWRVPAMFIQPYVENAIVHGLRHKSEGGRLEIVFRLNGDQMVCEIMDNGSGRNAQKTMDKHTPFSTAANKERVDLLNLRTQKGKYHIEYEDLTKDGQPKGTKVVLTIPQENESDHH